MLKIIGSTNTLQKPMDKLVDTALNQGSSSLDAKNTLFQLNLLVVIFIDQEH